MGDISLLNIDAIEAQHAAYCDETERGVEQRDLSEAALEFDMGCTLYVEQLIAEVGRLRHDVERWAADSCKEPWAHALAHNALGQAQDYCTVCEMNWPCPSEVLLGWKDSDA